MSLKISRAPLGQLQEVLPRLLSRLSIGRAQIALEQLRSNLQNRPHDEVLFYLAHEHNQANFANTEPLAPSTPVAALIAIQQPCIDQTSSSDVATIVHADFLIHPSAEVPRTVKNKAQATDPASDLHALTGSADQHAVITQMRSYVERDFTNRGIRFVQWATDVADQLGLGAQQWHEGLGYQQIATLDYLTGNADLSGSDINQEPKVPEVGVNIELRAVVWDSEQRHLEFTKLVEATYAGTLDCPDLAKYRTTDETLRGYQTAASFAPDLWFEVWASNSPDRTPIGCLILAKHSELDENAPLATSNSKPGSNPTFQAQNQLAPKQSLESPVIEIVYMGLLPETRGKGFGRQLVDQAAKLTVNLGGTRFILGVDQTNQPARDIYNSKGMTPLLTETVWAKRVDSADPGST
ncbi:MAG: hypothetical protein CMM01_03565 [Rhodopirellula sp.]|nr:hypothetical protein [Rhodopirellula sp.]